MKYLKKYNESNTDDDVLKEVLLDLEDMGIIQIGIHKLGPGEIHTQRYNARERINWQLRSGDFNAASKINQDLISDDQYLISFLYPTKSVMNSYFFGKGVTPEKLEEFKKVRKDFDGVLEELYVIIGRLIDRGFKVDGFKFYEMLTGKNGYEFQINISK